MNKSENYQICSRCVMDNHSDKTIFFDEHGHCNYCNQAIKNMENQYFPGEKGKKKLDSLLDEIKGYSKNKKYDCIMGISGGLDSSYLLYLGSQKWGLRILALHIDDGFDTTVSKENIKKLVEYTNVDLITIKPDYHQYIELTRAYILADVPNIAVPQDNILFAEIYKYMRKHKIKYFLSGGNFSLESILQRGNTYDCFDTRNIFDINNKFGRSKLNKLNLISNFRRDIDKLFLRVKTIKLLDYIDYSREKSLKDLKDFCDFQYYGSKHLENKLTKFIQVYWFYHKFNVDKRRSHYSSMIVSRQMDREYAIELLKKSPYDENTIKSEIKMILNELDIDDLLWDEIINRPPKTHQEYKTSLYVRIRRFIIDMVRKTSLF